VTWTQSSVLLISHPDAEAMLEEEEEEEEGGAEMLGGGGSVMLTLLAPLLFVGIGYSGR
jgi:hypothetical protein